MALVFSWNPAKARVNRRKHGISFTEAVTAFTDPFSITVGDADHSAAESRYILIGRSHRGRLLVVAHAAHSEREVRLISARPATRRERRQYEEEDI